MALTNALGQTVDGITDKGKSRREAARGGESQDFRRLHCDLITIFRPGEWWEKGWVETRGRSRLAEEGAADWAPARTEARVRRREPGGQKQSRVKAMRLKPLAIRNLGKNREEQSHDD